MFLSAKYRVISLQVEVSFLMVGHTHEAVDRFFSYISRLLKARGSTMTTQELHEAISSYLNEIHIEVLDLEFVADWKQWIAGCSEEIHDHTGKGSALHWRFKRDTAGGPVLMRTKHLHSDAFWLPEEGVQLVLKDPVGNPVAAHYYPLGRNDPTYFDKLRKTIRLCDEFGFLNEVQLKWWQDFFAEEEKDEIPEKYLDGSPFAQRFPVREIGEQQLRLDEEHRSITLRDEDRRQFGEAQRKQVYTGRSQPRKRRNEINASFEDLSVGSIVMLKGTKEEPLYFGKVTEVSQENRTVKLHYYGREDNSKCDISGKFTAMYTGTRARRGKKGETHKWIGVHGFDSILCFDLATTNVKKYGFRLSAKAQERCLEAIENLGDLEAESEDSSEESNAGEDTEDEDSNED